MLVFAILIAALMTWMAARWCRDSLNPRALRGAGDGVTDLAKTLLWVAAIYMFITWAIGPYWAFLPIAYVLVMATSPWAHRSKTPVVNGPVRYGESAPVPVEPGTGDTVAAEREASALEHPAPTLTQSDAETFDDIVRRIEQDR